MRRQPERGIGAREADSFGEIFDRWHRSSGPAQACGASAESVRDVLF
jgi:hypothetical protein